MLLSILTHYVFLGSIKYVVSYHWWRANGKGKSIIIFHSMGEKDKSVLELYQFLSVYLSFCLYVSMSLCLYVCLSMPVCLVLFDFVWFVDVLSLEIIKSVVIVLCLQRPKHPPINRLSLLPRLLSVLTVYVNIGRLRSPCMCTQLEVFSRFFNLYDRSSSCCPSPVYIYLFKHVGRGSNSPSCAVRSQLKVGHLEQQYVHLIGRLHSPCMCIQLEVFSRSSFQL